MNDGLRGANVHSKLRFGSLNVGSICGKSMEVAGSCIGGGLMYAMCRKQGGKEVLQGLLSLKVKDTSSGGKVEMVVEEWG